MQLLFLLVIFLFCWRLVYLGSFIFCRCRWLPLQLWWSFFWLDNLELAGDESSREDALRFDAQSPRDETCLWEEGKQARNDPLNAVNLKVTEIDP